MASIELSDEGPGIPDNALEHVFEKFYRIPGSSAEGLGLGLSIAKNLVELHGGKISVSNKQGSGATFTVELPYKNPPKEIGELNQ